MNEQKTYGNAWKKEWKYALIGACVFAIVASVLVSTPTVNTTNYQVSGQ